MRDLHERLWQLAKETAWSERPGKSDLRSLAVVLPPGERLIGTCQLPFRMMADCVFTITDRTLYLSSGNEHKYWKNLRASAPERFHVGDLVLSVPLTEVDTCTITGDGFFVLQIRNEPEITFHVFQAYSCRELLDKFFNTARREMLS